MNAQRRRLLRFALVGVAAACIPACRKSEPNGHGKDTSPDNETRHARFPLSNFPPIPSPQSSGGTTSHSTSPSKDDVQLAGYPASGRGGEREAGQAGILSQDKNSQKQSLIPAEERANESLREFHARELAQGDRFPDVVLPGLDGRMTSLADYPDVPLVVNFWATWCEPCRREMPSLEKLSTFFYPRDFRVVGITVDSDRNLAREFSLRYKLTIPMLSDSDRTLSSGMLRIPAFPITYLLRQDRTIARIIVGARDWASSEMVNEIEGLLAVRRISAT